MELPHMVQFIHVKAARLILHPRHINIVSHVFKHNGPNGCVVSDE